MTPAHLAAGIRGAGGSVPGAQADQQQGDGSGDGEADRENNHECVHLMFALIARQMREEHSPNALGKISCHNAKR